MVNFLKYRLIYAAISIVVIGIGMFSIGLWGYRYSIDFAGGSNLIYRLDRVQSKETIAQVFKREGIEVVNLKITGRDIEARTKALNEKQELSLRNALEKNTEGKVTILRSETVGPIIGKESVRKTVIASIIAIVGILLYMSYAFKSFNFALAAVIALIHDFLVVVGCYSIFSHFFGAEVDTLFVTAILTSMSFSVHDTIIIFDKIREYLKTEGRGDMEHYANRALTETLVRSLNNSMTIIFMLLALVLLGGSTITFFAATLLVGTVTGSYSSPFVATPLVVWLEKRKR
jgi:preprotein translocase subunit SecF